MIAGTRVRFGDKAGKALEVIKSSLRSILVPSDLTRTGARLLRDSSRVVTGQAIFVEGGALMH